MYGAQHLLSRSSPAALSVLQLFSSLAAFSGAAGQASYAAANGTLDAWAHDAQVLINQQALHNSQHSPGLPS